MEFIKGYTFGFCAPRGSFLEDSTKESLKLMQERTGATHVIFALAALQDTPHSIEVDWRGEHMVSDEELVGMIDYAKSLGLKPILKPLVNVRNGTWRAHINFFDYDVPCEPKWKDWFESYTRYQCHYAKIAEQTNCGMLVVGCEMVQTERRETEWRALINKVREIYTGLITYNTDKYQEDHIHWWDALDVISASGYYPIHDWDRQLDRIEAVVNKYQKPFFFAEAGCSSKVGASLVPNDWTLSGGVNLQEQVDYYEKMFEKTSNRPWVEGFGIWDWSYKLYSEITGIEDSDYAVFGKPAAKVIRNFYNS